MLFDHQGNPLETPSETQGVSRLGPDYTRDATQNVDLGNHPDAIQCTAGQHLFVPEIFDGEYIVHVMRLQGDPPGAEALAVCPRCLELLFSAKVLTRDIVKGYTVKH